MSSVLVGDVVYIGSRNVEPVQIVAYHVPTGKVVGQTELATGHTIQTMAADAAARYLYAGVLQKSTGPQPNLYRWDLATLSSPATPSGASGTATCATSAWPRTDASTRWAGAARTAPALWEYNPATAWSATWACPTPGQHWRGPSQPRTRQCSWGRQHPGRRGQRGARLPRGLRPGEPSFTAVTPSEMLARPQHQGPGNPRGQADDRLRGLDRAVQGRAHGAGNPASMRVATSSARLPRTSRPSASTCTSPTKRACVTTPSRRTRSRRPDVGGPRLGEIWGVDARNGKILVDLRLRLHRRDRSRRPGNCGHRPGEAGAPRHRADRHGHGCRRRIHLRRRQRRDRPPLDQKPGKCSTCRPGRGRRTP